MEDLALPVQFKVSMKDPTANPHFCCAKACSDCIYWQKFSEYGPKFILKEEEEDQTLI